MIAVVPVIMLLILILMVLFPEGIGQGSESFPDGTGQGAGVVGQAAPGLQGGTVGSGQLTRTSVSTPVAGGAFNAQAEAADPNAAAVLQQTEAPETAAPEAAAPETAALQGAGDQAGAADPNAEPALSQNQIAAEEGQPMPAEQAMPEHQTAGAAPQAAIPIQKLRLSADRDDMILCDTLQITAEVYPPDASDPGLLWTSDDETVARVDQNGLVTAVGGGHAVITAIASSGVHTDFGIDVSSRKKRMTVSVNTEMLENNSVGRKWQYEYYVNGRPADQVREIIVSRGDRVTVGSTITENDRSPDIGAAEGTYTVDDDGFEQGFVMRQEITVLEDTPPNKGNAALFVVTYNFLDAVQ